MHMAPEGVAPRPPHKRAQPSSLLASLSARVLTAMGLLGLLVVLGAVGGSVSTRNANIARSASVHTTEMAMSEGAENDMPMAMPMMAPAMHAPMFKRSTPMADMEAGSSRGMPSGGGMSGLMRGGAAATATAADAVVGSGGGSGLDQVVADMAASA